MPRFSVKFSEGAKSFKTDFKDLQTATIRQDVEYYEGEYAVTPKPIDQTLETKGKKLISDVIVKAIPKEYGLVTYDQNKTITVS